MKNGVGTKICLAIVAVLCVVLWFRVSELNTTNQELQEEIERLGNVLSNTRGELWSLKDEVEGDKTVEDLIKEEVAEFKYDGFLSFGNKKLTMAGNLVYLINTNEEIESMELVFGDETFAMNNDKEGQVYFEGSKEIDVSTIIDDEVRVKILYIRMKTTEGKEYKIYPEFSEWMNYQIKPVSFDEYGITQHYEVEIVE